MKEMYVLPDCQNGLTFKEDGRLFAFTFHDNRFSNKCFRKRLLCSNPTKGLLLHTDLDLPYTRWSL